MKSIHLLFITLILSSIIFSSCATIAGGSKYYAHVQVKDHPHAKIVYQGQLKGSGSASFKVLRKDAGNFTTVIKEEGCPDQQFNFTTRTFRGWAFVGSLVTFSLNITGVPIPIGVAIDLATGAFWKPNRNELNVNKIDYKNYGYTLNYQSCNTNSNIVEASGVDIIYLKNGSIIRGTIVESTSEEEIKIQTADKNIFVFKTDEIEKMTKEEASE